jgi:hypothetical protein
MRRVFAGVQLVAKARFAVLFRDCQDFCVRAGGRTLRRHGFDEAFAKRLATSLQLRPDATADATHSRRSFEYGLAVHTGLHTSQKVETDKTPRAGPQSNQSIRKRA